MTLKQRLGRLVYTRLPITRFLFDQLRVEAAALRLALRNRLNPRRRRRLKRLRAGSGLLLNVACGPHVEPGFVNLDLQPCAAEVVGWDCRRTLPLSDGAAEGVRVEHFIEHLEPREELPRFLREAHRVLRPGGTLRIVVPDAERYLRAYCRDDLQGFRALAVPEPFPQDLPTRMDLVNHVFHQWHEHRWGYDFETLADRLRAAGFTEIERRAYRVSSDSRLACDRAEHAPYSLYVEASRSESYQAERSRPINASSRRMSSR